MRMHGSKGGLATAYPAAKRVALMYARMYCCRVHVPMKPFVPSAPRAGTGLAHHASWWGTMHVLSAGVRGAATQGPRVWSLRVHVRVVEPRLGTSSRDGLFLAAGRVTGRVRWASVSS